MTDKMDLNEPVLLEEARSRKAASEASDVLEGVIMLPGDRVGETDIPATEETREETPASRKSGVASWSSFPPNR